jgi:hypothetical protein
MAGQFVQQALGNVEQCDYSPIARNASAGGLIHSCENPQQRGFTGAIMADKANPGPLFNAQGNVFQRAHEDNLMIIAANGSAHHGAHH